MKTEEGRAPCTMIDEAYDGRYALQDTGRRRRGGPGQMSRAMAMTTTDEDHQENIEDEDDYNRDDQNQDRTDNSRTRRTGGVPGHGPQQTDTQQ